MMMLNSSLTGVRILAQVANDKQSVWYGPRHDDAAIGGTGHTAQGSEVEALFTFINWVSVVSLVLVCGLAAYFVIRYRRRQGVPIERSPAHHTVLEVAWTIVPTIFLVIMFFWGFWAYADGQVAGADAETIDVTAQKWNWDFQYSNGAVSTVLVDKGGYKEAKMFLVPADTPVLLRMKSVDVIHSFFVPDFRSKADVFPNRMTSYTFRTNPLTEEFGYLRNDPKANADADLGTNAVWTSEYKYREHVIFCAEYCGDAHSRMSAVLRVVEPEVYRDLVSQWTKPPDGTPPIEIGNWAYVAKGCNGCHSIDGGANTGPTWQNLFGYENQYADGSSVTVDENHIRESILMPGAKVRQGYANQMSIIKLEEREIDGLIAYIRSLSDKAPSSGLLDSGNEG